MPESAPSFVPKGWNLAQKTVGIILEVRNLPLFSFRRLAYATIFMWCRHWHSQSPSSAADAPDACSGLVQRMFPCTTLLKQATEPCGLPSREPHPYPLSPTTGARSSPCLVPLEMTLTALEDQPSCAIHR
jgi:hypothetical protein